MTIRGGKILTWFFLLALSSVAFATGDNEPSIDFSWHFTGPECRGEGDEYGVTYEKCTYGATHLSKLQCNLALQWHFLKEEFPYVADETVTVDWRNAKHYRGVAPGTILWRCQATVLKVYPPEASTTP